MRSGRLKKCLENFSVLLGGSEANAVRKLWAGLSPVGRQLKVAIWVFVKKGSDFVQKVPPIYDFRVSVGCWLALASLGLGNSNDFIRIFEIQKQFLRPHTEIEFAEDKHKFENFINQSFLSPEGRQQSDNLILIEK